MAAGHPLGVEYALDGNSSNSSISDKRISDCSRLQGPPIEFKQPELPEDSSGMLHISGNIVDIISSVGVFDAIVNPDNYANFPYCIQKSSFTPPTLPKESINSTGSSRNIVDILSNI